MDPMAEGIVPVGPQFDKILFRPLYSRLDICLGTLTD